MGRNTPQAALWRGRAVRMVDDTTVSMPDTPENQEQWPQPISQQPGCGFPLLKLVGLFCLATGALLRCVHSSLAQHEAVLARLLWPLLSCGDILLADRGFCSFFDLHALRARGVDALMRLHQRRRGDFRAGHRLGKDDRLVVWTKPAQRSKVWSQEDYDALPATLTLRMLRYRIAVPGFRTEEVILVTTLPLGHEPFDKLRALSLPKRLGAEWLDAQAYPLDALAELYFQRWSVELHPFDFAQGRLFARSKRCSAWMCCAAAARR